MSLLAGFDCVFELSATAVGQFVLLALGNLTLPAPGGTGPGGLPGTLPPLPDATNNVWYDIGIDDQVTVTLGDDPSFSIQIHCDWVLAISYVTNQIQGGPNSGFLTIANAAFGAVQSGSLPIDWSEATFTFNLPEGPQLEAQLNKYLADASLTGGQTLVRAALSDEAGALAVPFTISPATNGSPASGSFTALINRISAAGGTPALVFFGNFLTTSVLGDPSTHNVSMLGSGESDFAGSLSKSTCDTFFFCPALTTGLGATPPGSCRGPGPVAVRGALPAGVTASITSVTTTFLAVNTLGAILPGSLISSGICLFDVNVALAKPGCLTMEAETLFGLVATVTAGSLTFALIGPTPPQLTFPKLSGACSLGGVAIAFAWPFNNIFAAAFAASIPKPTIPAFAVPNITPSAASIGVEALTVLGMLVVPAPPDPPQPTVTLSGSILSEQVSSTAAYTSTKYAPVNPLLAHVRKLLVKQVASYTASMQNAPGGSQLVVWLAAQGKRYDLADGESLELIVDAVQPFGQYGSVPMSSTVSLQVALNPQTDGSLIIALTANPNDGNYQFVIATAIDVEIDGQLAPVAATSVTVLINGEQYTQPITDTLGQSAAINTALSDLRRTSVPFLSRRQYTPITPGDPDPVDFQEVLVDVLMSGDPRALDLAQQIVAVQGAALAAALRATDLALPSRADARATLGMLKGV